MSDFPWCGNFSDAEAVHYGVGVTLVLLRQQLFWHFAILSDVTLGISVGLNICCVFHKNISWSQPFLNFLYIFFVFTVLLFANTYDFKDERKTT